MATSGLSKKDILQKLTDNDESYVSLDMSHFSAAGSELTSKDFTSFAEALTNNTVVTEIKMLKVGMKDSGAVSFANVLKSNSTIVYVDLGYNKIGPDGMKALGEALKENSTITECKLHRQEKDMGSSVENIIADLWGTNTTLQRLYITLHDRRCNQANTAGEVRNKEIAKLIKNGKSWEHLDPARAEQYKAKKKAAEEEKKRLEALANAPISEKVDSTGGPYTLKQLTCKKEFRPDDIDPKKLEEHLADDEFEQVFSMTKDEFAKLPQWKRNNFKKQHKLH